MTNDPKNDNAKIAYAIVGVILFYIIWQVWDSLGLSVFAVSAAAPKASATGFNGGVIATSVLGPITAVVMFFLSATGKLVVDFVAALIGLAKARDEPPSPDVSKFVAASKLSPKLKVVNERLEALESRMTDTEDTIQSWEFDEAEEA